MKSLEQEKFLQRRIPAPGERIGFYIDKTHKFSANGIVTEVKLNKKSILLSVRTRVVQNSLRKGNHRVKMSEVLGWMCENREIVISYSKDNEWR